jgi:chemotaxis protein CheD
MSETNTIEVEMGQVKIAMPPTRLRASALGSCVACVLYDQVEQIGGIAHVMLPSTDYYLRGDDPLKYADQAVPYLIKLLVEDGANKYGLHARLVGGALMVKDSEDIGSEVERAIEEILFNQGIEIVAKRVGGRLNRIAMLDTCTGTLWYAEADGIEKVL